MKYKVGDKVRLINSLIYAGNRGSGLNVFRDWLGKVVTIDTAKDGFYTATEIKGYFLTEDLIAEKVLSLSKEDEEWINDFLAGQNAVNFGITLPDGYEFRDENGNVIEAKKIVLEKKKPKYPKSYDVCCDLIGARIKWVIPLNKKEADEYPQEASILRLLDDMRALLICRDAYWYCYAKENNMPFNWKPDWAMYSKPKHCIIYSDNEIKWQGKHFVTEAKVLAFPTAEMRDAFYENFKDLIEVCKELL